MSILVVLTSYITRRREYLGMWYASYNPHHRETRCMFWDMLSLFFSKKTIFLRLFYFSLNFVKCVFVNFNSTMIGKSCSYNIVNCNSNHESGNYDACIVSHNICHVLFSILAPRKARGILWVYTNNWYEKPLKLCLSGKFCEGLTKMTLWNSHEFAGILFYFQFLDSCLCIPVDNIYLSQCWLCATMSPEASVASWFCRSKLWSVSSES
jgi:hypothetical protein